MSPVKPSVVLVPGAFHLPSTYDLLVPCLNKAGYQTKGVTLPSIGADIPLSDASQDVEAVRAVVESLVEDGKDVVLVVHSYGGVPGSEAAKDLSKEFRTAHGSEGGVVHIVYLAAFACAEGESLSDALRSEPATFIEFQENGHCTAKDAGSVFYNDVPPAIAGGFIDRLRTHSAATFMSPLQYAAWKHIPSTYVVCTMDKAIRSEVTERMVAQHGTKWSEVVRLRSGHSPMISMPEETANIIRRAAGEHGVPAMAEG